MLVLAGNRYHSSRESPADRDTWFNTSFASSTPWHFAGSNGRDVALARDKVSRAAWPLSPEKGDASFMVAARLALVRRRGVRG